MWPVGAGLDAVFRPLTDSRDGGPLMLTHLYLLVGFATPLWLYPLRHYDQGVQPNGLCHKYSHVCKNPMLKCTLYNAHMHTHTCTHAHTHAHACTHARAHTQTHTNTHTHTTHTHTNTHTHTHNTHTHTHTTHTHTHTHNTHTHTHTHTQPASLPCTLES